MCLNIMFLYLADTQKRLIDGVSSNGNLSFLKENVILIVILSVGFIFFNRRSTQLSSKIINEKRTEIIENLIDYDIEQKNKSNIIAKINQHLNTFQIFFENDIPNAFKVFINIIIMSFGIFSIRPVFLIISILTSVLFSLTLLFLDKLKKIEEELAVNGEKEWKYFNDIYVNKFIFIFYHGAYKYIEKYLHLTETTKVKVNKKAKVIACVQSIGLISNIIREVLILIIAIKFFHMTMGGVISLFMLTSFLNAAIVSIIDTVNKIQKATISLNELKLEEFLIAHEKNYEEHSVLEFDKVKEIQIDNVLFESDNIKIYYPNSRFLSEEINIVSGSVGSGKTTLIKMISGLTNPTVGEIYFNEIEADMYTRRTYVKLVEQENRIFSGTILENITLFSPSHNISLDRVREVLSLCELIEWVDSLPEGINTIITDNISGGQKQRMCICRALYFEPRVLILDEPFSSLDIETSKKIASRLENMLNKDILVILIDHKGLMSGNRVKLKGANVLATQTTN